MPGKPFFSMDEVCAKLGKSSDQIKSLVREGTLREFRDAGKVFFKAEDIERLIAESAGGSDAGEILLEPAGREAPPADGLPSLGEDTSGGTSIIGLEPLADEQDEEKKEGTAIATRGIGVFDDDELETDADPMAKTQITPSTVGDQVSLEGAGSGSGLLDLAREADDTALGADLLDEIYPGEGEAPPAKKEASAIQEPTPAEEAPAEEQHAAALEETPVEAEVALAPALTVAGDAAEGIFSGMLVGTLALMALACTIVASVVQGYLPDFGKKLGDGSVFYFFLIGSVLLVVITLLMGWFLGKALLPRRR